MENTILDYYAERRTSYLHGGGRQATAHLFDQLQFVGKEKVLEIGFGIGASLLSLHCQFPAIDLYGIERTPKMYQTAQQRLNKVSGFEPELHLLQNQKEFPFAENYFDAIYIESVLGILSVAEINNLLTEIRRVLKPGGKLGLNETLWLDWVPQKESKRINEACMKVWGIPQANAELITETDWSTLLQETGFKLNYFSAHNARSVKYKRSFTETRILIQDKINHYLSGLKRQNRKQTDTLNNLPKELFQENKPYLNSFIMIAQ